MNAECINHLEELLDRKLTEKEQERFRRIKDILKISDNDALWDILIAMEYQRTYYEDLPQKIHSVTEEICQDIKSLAEHEVTIAQYKLAESVVAQAKNFSFRFNYMQIFIWGILFFIACMFSGAALMWMGYALG